MAKQAVIFTLFHRRRRDKGAGAPAAADIPTGHAAGADPQAGAEHEYLRLPADGLHERAEEELPVGRL